ncbi:hypothetical protein [Lutispora thermophila]|uniref:Uncharacterized protein n=1 Tax=Lutispora thermophila DSM 19022 TaxID=1122184 RepID=A0A1M6HD46_9FIRM|nr:hypothetical protein [Lutispora thermophila]SHJ20084.1 hypothetical protein SAMN02745176_02750 [Lutispora thermophila DSM 19022]
MEYNILFMVHKNAVASNSMAPIFDNYEWWLDLAGKALDEAEEFEMRLWKDDLEGIESGQRFGEKVPNYETKEVVFRGKITPQFKQEILTNYLAKKGHIKWFTLFLKKDNEYIFSSEHYGDETYVSAYTEEQVQAVQEWAKNYPIIWRVDVFECE